LYAEKLWPNQADNSRATMRWNGKFSTCKRGWWRWREWMNTKNILLLDSSSHSGQYHHCIATHSAVLSPVIKIISM